MPISAPLRLTDERADLLARGAVPALVHLFFDEELERLSQRNFHAGRGVAQPPNMDRTRRDRFRQFPPEDPREQVGGEKLCQCLLKP
jgi:hypothetical protein